MKNNYGKRARRVKVEDIFAAVRMISEAGLEEEFIQNCKKREFHLRINPTEARFIKAYLRSIAGLSLQSKDGEYDQCT